MDGRPVNILLAEDNASHAKLIMRCMADHAVANRIIHVTDGEAALDCLYQRGEYTDPVEFPPTDLLLLDLRLPKLDGLEVLKEVRTSQDFVRIPVVILTTSEAEADIAKAYQLHANSYLVKPIDFTDFSKMMKTLGFYWLVWNRSPSL